MKLKAKLKELTGRSNGMGYKQRKEALNLFIRGWVEYYKLARMKKTLETIDMWLRRRIRMCIWKSWKNPRTRIANLIKCGVPYMIFNDIRFHMMCKSTKNLGKSFAFGRKTENKWIIIGKITK